MSDNKKHIDDLFKDGLSNFELPDTDDVWSRVEETMSKKKKRRFGFWWFGLGIIAVAGIIVSVYVFTVDRALDVSDEGTVSAAVQTDRSMTQVESQNTHENAQNNIDQEQTVPRELENDETSAENSELPEIQTTDHDHSSYKSESLNAQTSTKSEVSSPADERIADAFTQIKKMNDQSKESMPDRGLPEVGKENSGDNDEEFSEEPSLVDRAAMGQGENSMPDDSPSSVNNSSNLDNEAQDQLPEASNEDSTTNVDDGDSTEEQEELPEAEPEAGDSTSKPVSEDDPFNPLPTTLSSLRFGLNTGVNLAGQQIGSTLMPDYANLKSKEQGAYGLTYGLGFSYHLRTSNNNLGLMARGEVIKTDYNFDQDQISYVIRDSFPVLDPQGDTIAMIARTPKDSFVSPKEQLRFSTIRIPLYFGGEYTLSPRLSLNLTVGADLNVISRSQGQTIDNRLELRSTDQLRQKSLTWSLGGEVGVNIALKRNLYWGIGVSHHRMMTNLYEDPLSGDIRLNSWNFKTALYYEIGN